MSKADHEGRYCCDFCGNFHRRLPGNIYKLAIKGKTFHFCSWTCYESAKRIKASTSGEDARRRLEKRKEKFSSNEEVC